MRSVKSQLLQKSQDIKFERKTENTIKCIYYVRSKIRLSMLHLKKAKAITS